MSLLMNIYADCCPWPRLKGLSVNHCSHCFRNQGFKWNVTNWKVGYSYITKAVFRANCCASLRGRSLMYCGHFKEKLLIANKVKVIVCFSVGNYSPIHSFHKLRDQFIISSIISSGLITNTTSAACRIYQGKSLGFSWVKYQWLLWIR